jgi:hypothetical protein
MNGVNFDFRILSAIGTGGLIWLSRRAIVVVPDLKLGSPVSIRQVGTFGLIFLLIPQLPLVPTPHLPNEWGTSVNQKCMRN